MRPGEYYLRMTARIKEADVRLVAACMTDYVGEENAVRIERLAARVGMGERQVRDILETLVKSYGIPIGAHAGKAGRWIIANEGERRAVLADLASRVTETNARIRALREAKLAPAEPLRVELVQPTLLDEPVAQRANLSYWGY